MPSIESVVSRVVVEVSGQLSGLLDSEIRKLRVVEGPGSEETEQLLRDLGLHAEKLAWYLTSPEFKTVVAGLRLLPHIAPLVHIQIRHDLRLAELPAGMLDRATNLVHRLAVIDCDARDEPVAVKMHHQDLQSSVVHANDLLGRLTSLVEIHGFAARLRAQISALHSTIRLPHIGISRAVSYDRLYVNPAYSPSGPRFTAPGDRFVVLGDPGAGKSTMAAKLAYDIAQDPSGRVPLLIVLREFTSSFDHGGHDLVHFLKMACASPYNVRPPQHAIEYLLHSGRAVVILDGLDELVETDLRRRVVEMVEGFVHLYPLVPMLVTARRIGYDEAPLSGSLFDVSTIVEFWHSEVVEYAWKWFDQDDSTAPPERRKVADSFLEDSKHIAELRSNPLLLALLCAMYSSDRYMPSSLAEVYERCALMLFEQWDAKRRIPMPMQFRGRLRGAVQHLAWAMFTAPESGAAQTRTQIIRTLGSYLEAKVSDPDEAQGTAEQFLAFCTGRAWILTDVGATSIEPKFGFTHRTFLEYFAAEHLVRTHRTAKALWAALEPNVVHGQWEVVGQIALQLYERNVADGTDELLSQALAGRGLDFAARALHHSHPGREVVRSITRAALDRAAAFPIESRLSYGGTPDPDQADQALIMVMNRCAPANLPTVEHAVFERLADLVRRRHDSGALLLDHLVSPHFITYRPQWTALQQRLSVELAAEMAELRIAPWAAAGFRNNPDFLAKIVSRHGAHTLYQHCVVTSWSKGNIAFSLLQANSTPMTREHTDALAVAMTTSATPWAHSRSFAQFDKITKLPLMESHLPLITMLCMPYLETMSSRKRRPGSAKPSPMHRMLVEARNGVAIDLATWQIDHTDMPDAVRAFLIRWINGEISVT